MCSEDYSSSSVEGGLEDTTIRNREMSEESVGGLYGA